MQLVWSLHPLHVAAWRYYSYHAPLGSMRVTLQAAGASATVTRNLRAAGIRVTNVRPAQSGFYGDFFAPPAGFRGRRRPAILDFGGSEGGLSTSESAALYASEGYPTLALAYFREPGLPRNLVRIPLEYFARALRWLAVQPDVDRGKIVVKGVSRGSEAAQLLGIHYPNLVHAVIALVPSNGAVCGIRPVAPGTQDYRCAGPAWTFRGNPVPYFDNPTLGANPHPFPDERINGPVFLLCAGHDNIWPSCPMSQRIVSRLRAHHFRHSVTFLDYPDAGHGLGSLIPYYPGPDPANLAGAARQANQIARADAWPKLNSFLRTIRNG